MLGKHWIGQEVRHPVSKSYSVGSCCFKKERKHCSAKPAASFAGILSVNVQDEKCAAYDAARVAKISYCCDSISAAIAFRSRIPQPIPFSHEKSELDLLMPKVDAPLHEVKFLFAKEQVYSNSFSRYNGVYKDCRLLYRALTMKLSLALVINNKCAKQKH